MPVKHQIRKVKEATGYMSGVQKSQDEIDMCKSLTYSLNLKVLDQSHLRRDSKFINGKKKV